MEKFRLNVLWRKGLESRHQLQINRKNQMKMVTIPSSIMRTMGHADIKTTMIHVDIN
ncbi:MAG: hypothetical protein IH577_03995 [Deltaproteobacteria bacterium]|nr:hypothetical protein [Deltaproteobacteria bacterium]